MNILLIYAHFEQRSFNSAMRQMAVTTLTEAGHQVRIADLYEEKFFPVPDPAAFLARANEEHFDLMREQEFANQRGTLPTDVRREQERVQWADVLLFQFPLWWWSMPAILKGWVDRVFSKGFAYGSKNLIGKSAMLSVTAETKAKRFSPDATRSILDHIETGILHYCGLTLLPKFVAAEVLSITDAERVRILSDYREHLRNHVAFPPSPAG